MRKPTIGELIREQLGVISSFNQQIYNADNCIDSKIPGYTVIIQQAINKLETLSNSKGCQRKIRE